jgi:hypothetical protein
MNFNSLTIEKYIQPEYMNWESDIHLNLIGTTPGDCRFSFMSKVVINV